MGSMSVNVTFEAKDRAEALATVDKWVLHSGCAVSMTFQEMLPPGATNEDGGVILVPGIPEPSPPIDPKSADAVVSPLPPETTVEAAPPIQEA